MPLIQVNVRVDGAAGQLDQTGGVPGRLHSALDALPPDAPVIVLLHGYKFSPRLPAHDPHRHILSLDPRPDWRAISWPRRLGLGAGNGAEPLCIALGWEARGTLRQVYGRAAAAGAGVADLTRQLRARRPDAPVNVLAHSLGARVALSALPHLAPGDIGRLVLLAAAELRSQARAALDSPGGRQVEVVNVTSRENAVFDHLFEWLVPPVPLADRALGHGLDEPRENWVDLAIADAGTRAALARQGFDIPPPDRRICHWSVYLRRGVFDLYRAVLTQRIALSALRVPKAAQPSDHGSAGHGPRPGFALANLPALPFSFAQKGAP